LERQDGGIRVNVETDSPYYIEREPSRNQGVFVGDGNKYRFDFEVWSGDKVPGGAPGASEDIYYCFYVGNEDDPTFIGSPHNIRCWIKKEVFEAVSTNLSTFAIYAYNTGQLVILFGNTVVGLILPDMLMGASGLWGLDSLGFLYETDMVYDSTSIAPFETARQNYLVLDGIEKRVILYTGIFNVDENRVVVIQREDQLVYYGGENRVGGIYTLVPTLDESDTTIMTGLYISVPDLFFFNDRGGISVRTEIDQALPNPILVEDHDPPFDCGESFFTPTNSVADPITASETEYRMLEIDSLDDTIVSATRTVTNNSSVYDQDIAGLLSDEDELKLYITILYEGGEEGGEGGEGGYFDGDYSGTLNHTLTAIPSAGENELNVHLASVFFDADTYWIKDIAPFSYILERGSGILLKTPCELDFGDPPDDSEFDHVVDLEMDEAHLDLNSEDHQSFAKLKVTVPDTNGKEWNLPANFVNARYYAQTGEDTSMGVVRFGEADETRPLKVALAGVDEPPQMSSDNRFYGFAENDQWGLFKFEDVKLVESVEGDPYFTFNKAVYNAKTFGSTSETDFAAGSAYDPSNPDPGKDGVSITLSLGQFYDHTAAPEADT